MNPITRVLALDLHPLSFGFALFDGADELLDWGIKNFRHGVNAVKVPMPVKLALLLDQYEPDVLIMKNPMTAKLKRMVRRIAVLAHARDIPVRLMPDAFVRGAFPDDTRNKYQIAAVIAARYPELSHRLGPRRKLWQAEKYSMSLFDAAALGVAYFTDNTTAGKSEGIEPFGRFLIDA